MLSSTRFITETDLQTARRVQEEPATQPKHKETQKAGKEPSAKRGQQKYRPNGEDVIGVADSEVRGQVGH